jgi:hypothetical protein
MDILILSNAPGELVTWVYPMLRQITARSQEFPQPLRVSIVLSPCSNASGKEAAIAQSIPGVDRVLPPEQFWQFLLWGKLAWDWQKSGIIIFLGGDQIYPVAIAKRLGYPTLIYAEWEARWQGWVDRFALRNAQVKVLPQFQSKALVVGDLMVDRASSGNENSTKTLKIAFLPGSKSMKLAQGVPLSLAIADLLEANFKHSEIPLELAIILAPTLTPAQLATYAQATNPVIPLVQGTTAILEQQEETYFLRTLQGTLVKIYTEFPSDRYLKQCTLCVTTVGANTAELGALGVPMVVLLPTNQIEAMRSWDGLLGAIVNLPGVGNLLAKLVNQWMAGRLGLLAWPNIWAGEEIVPEMRGLLTPELVTEKILSLLSDPKELEMMSDRLQSTCGKPGAADKIVDLALELISLRCYPKAKTEGKRKV